MHGESRRRLFVRESLTHGLGVAAPYHTEHLSSLSVFHQFPAWSCFTVPPVASRGRHLSLLSVSTILLGPLPASPSGLLPVSSSPAPGDAARLLPPLVGGSSQTCRERQWLRAGQGDRHPGILGTGWAGLSPSRVHSKAVWPQERPRLPISSCDRRASGTQSWDTLMRDETFLRGCVPCLG